MTNTMILGVCIAEPRFLISMRKDRGWNAMDLPAPGAPVTRTRQASGDLIPMRSRSSSGRRRRSAESSTSADSFGAPGSDPRALSFLSLCFWRVLGTGMSPNARFWKFPGFGGNESGSGPSNFGFRDFRSALYNSKLSLEDCLSVYILRAKIHGTAGRNGDAREG
jgi:hypothetical protein